MLRAKQLSNLSSTARSFFLNGSRCSAADGSSSCTCSEDETCVSRRQQPRNTILLAQKPAILVSKASARVETLVSGGDSFLLPKKTSSLESKPSPRVETPVSGEAVKSLGSHKDECIECSTSLPQAACAPNALGGSGCVGYASGINVSEKHATLSSPPFSDQFVRAGIAAVTFMSDLVSHKLPNGTELNTINNCMVDPTSQVANGRSSNVRRENFTKAYPKSAELPVGLNPPSRYDNKKDKGNKSSFARGFKQVASTASDNSSDSHSVQLYAFDKRRTISQRQKAQYNRFVPEFNSCVNTSDSSIGEWFTEGYRRPLTAVATPVASQFISSRYVVENVSHILRQLGWGPAAEEALGNLNCPMDPYQANQVLKQLQDHTVALGFFYWLKRQHGFKRDGHTYTTMLGILGRA